MHRPGPAVEYESVVRVEEVERFTGDQAGDGEERSGDRNMGRRGRGVRAEEWFAEGFGSWQGPVGYQYAIV